MNNIYLYEIITFILTLNAVSKSASLTYNTSQEPTSGLDAYAAQSLICSLKRLAVSGGRSIVLSLHQPSSRVFHMLDSVLLLSRGEVGVCWRFLLVVYNLVFRLTKIFSILKFFHPNGSYEF